MNLPLATTLLGTAAVAASAWSLGGAAGAGAALGGGLGLLLGGLATARQRSLLRTAPARAQGAFALGFLTKLMVLLAAVLFFRLAGLEGALPVAFCLAFLAACLYATAAGWLGGIPRSAAGAPTRVHDREVLSR